MKIAISGVTGLRNRGVEALVDPLVTGLREIFPQASFTVFSGSADYDASRGIMHDLEVVAEGAFLPVSKTLKQRVAEKLHLVPTRVPIYRWPGFADFDLLVVTGGDVFSSEYGDWSFERHLVPMRIAHQQGTPIVIFAQSIGPFTSEHHRDSWMKEASKAALISVREKRTYEYLTGDLGLSRDKVKFVADPAFLLHANDSTKQWLRRSWQSNEGVVAIALSQGICQWSGVSREAWLATWVELIRRMIQYWRVKIVLVPHVQEPYANDLIACTDVWRLLEFPEEVSVLGADLSASEYKGIISECSMVIAERMHAGIAGLSSGVCTSIVAYSVKARGVIADVLGSELAAEGAALEASAFVSADVVWNKIDRIWNKRSIVAGQIAKQLPNIQAMAKSAFEMLPAALMR
jgi:colanic acid/amylovoran biosynthesis protein